MGLKDERLKLGFTLHGLADKSGVNYMKIYQIENDIIKVDNITLRNAIKLSKALDIKPEDLLK